ncbi:hypothetical protein BOTBODRAFT_333513 [Botryobasidium botryosum FD-172 SS1]|uniref:Uncharacterized protein n=1 Tax=Botryobasidium botryosum (strain FD-172 SS1) TaxID=930990 RepID=A0A067MHE2_BOTB1|nr:hypothetical protein BOTBODRAFT_333513 [Botryobasidium botryosum FD-172 SS1]
MLAVEVQPISMHQAPCTSIVHILKLAIKGGPSAISMIFLPGARLSGTVYFRVITGFHQLYTALVHSTIQAESEPHQSKIIGAYAPTRARNPLVLVYRQLCPIWQMNSLRFFGRWGSTEMSTGPVSSMRVLRRPSLGTRVGSRRKRRWKLITDCPYILHARVFHVSPPNGRPSVGLRRNIGGMLLLQLCRRRCYIFKQTPLEGGCPPFTGGSFYTL